MIATVTCAFAGCNADRPKLTSAADGGVTPCSTFADLVVGFTDASGNSASAGPSLGAPDGSVVAIGINASLTVAFIGAGALVDETGDDLRIHGTVRASAVAVAYVVNDSGDTRFLGDLTSLPADLDLATASESTATEIRIVGMAGELSIDAFEAIQLSCPL